MIPAIDKILIALLNPSSFWILVAEFDISSKKEAPRVKAFSNSFYNKYPKYRAYYCKYWTNYW